MVCRTKLLGKARGCKQLRLSLSPDAPSWPAQQSVLTGPDPWPVLSGGLRRNHPLLQTLSQTHSELPHAGKWCMETWPTWWGNLLGTDRKALGRSGKPGPTGTGTSLQGGLPRVWPSYLPTGLAQAEISLDACRSPASNTVHASLWCLWTWFTLFLLPLRF